MDSDILEVTVPHFIISWWMLVRKFQGVRYNLMLYNVLMISIRKHDTTNMI